MEKGSCCVPEGYYYHGDNEPWLSRRRVAVYQRGTIITVTMNHDYREGELLCTSRGTIITVTMNHGYREGELLCTRGVLLSQ